MRKLKGWGSLPWVNASENQIWESFLAPWVRLVASEDALMGVLMEADKLRVFRWGNLIQENSLETDLPLFATMGRFQSQKPQEEELNLRGCSLVALSGGRRHVQILTSQSSGESSHLVLGRVGRESEPTVHPFGKKDVTAVASGGDHAFAIAEQKVWSWGSGSNFVLGHSDEMDQKRPRVVKGMNHVTALSVGLTHGIALSSIAGLLGWGDNRHGQLGPGMPRMVTKPVSLKLPPLQLDESIVHIGAGGMYSVVATSRGRVLATGDNTYKQAPQAGQWTEVGQMDNLQDLVVGRFHSLLRTATGEVYGWGLGVDGQLGEHLRGQLIPNPTLVSSEPWDQVVAGPYYTAGIITVVN